MKKNILNKKYKLLKESDIIFMYKNRKIIYCVKKNKPILVCNSKTDIDVDKLFDLLYIYITRNNINYFEF